MQEQEPAEGQVDRLGQAEVFPGLGDGQDLAEGGRRGSAASSRAAGSLSTA